MTIKMHMYLTIVMNNLVKQNLTTNFMCACDNYFGQISQLMRTSLTIVSDKFDSIHICLTIFVHCGIP